VYKDFPIVELHPQAHLAAEAAQCAGEQGRFWEMHGMLFERPSEWDTVASAARVAFEEYALTLQLDVEQFGGCLDEGRYQQRVQTTLAEGRYLGMTGTPGFVINGKFLGGAQPTEIFKRVLDRELNTLE
jgi:protein-disulfide isomerase